MDGVFKKQLMQLSNQDVNEAWGILRVRDRILRQEAAMGFNVGDRVSWGSNKTRRTMRGEVVKINTSTATVKTEQGTWHVSANLLKKVTALFIAALLAGTTWADGLSVSIENDIMTGSDNNYSHATEIKWNVTGQSRTGDVFLTSVGLRQAFYTPEDISDPVIHSYDHNYCGVAVLFYQQWQKEQLLGDDEYVLYEVDIGVLGPAALGKETQSYAHRIIPGNIQPQGWAQQYQNEPIVNGYMERHNGIINAGDRDGFGARLEALSGASVGTTWVNTFVGGEAKLGWNIPDFVSDNVFPMKAVQGGFARTRDFYSYLKFESRGYAQIWNATLGQSMYNNNQYARSPTPFVAENSVGFVLGYGALSFCYLRTMRTMEFYGQQHGMDYGTLIVNLGATF